MLISLLSHSLLLRSFDECALRVHYREFRVLQWKIAVQVEETSLFSCKQIFFLFDAFGICGGTGFENHIWKGNVHIILDIHFAAPSMPVPSKCCFIVWTCFFFFSNIHEASKIKWHYIHFSLSNYQFYMLPNEAFSDWEITVQNCFL